MESMLCNIIAVGGGSAAGGLARWFISRWMQEAVGAGAGFPWGTFVVNLAGALLIGIIYGLLDRGVALSASMRLFLTVGFCGGFTTFSTFINENRLLFEQGNHLMLALYAGISVAGGFFLLMLGHRLAS